MSEKAAKKQKRGSWFKGLKSEFKKVVWPDKQTLARQMIAVIVSSVMIGVIITIVDQIVQYGLEFIVR